MNMLLYWQIHYDKIYLDKIFVMSVLAHEIAKRYINDKSTK